MGAASDDVDSEREDPATAIATAIDGTTAAVSHQVLVDLDRA
jgi:hypothetical protein